MKAFKKLAAVVLAGVMSLAVLTGCSDSDKTTFHKQLTDALADKKIAATYNGQEVLKANKAAENYVGFVTKAADIEAEHAKGVKGKYWDADKKEMKEDAYKKDMIACYKDFIKATELNATVDDKGNVTSYEDIDMIKVQEDSKMVAAIIADLSDSDIVTFGYSNSAIQYKDKDNKTQSAIVLVMEHKTADTFNIFD